MNVLWSLAVLRWPWFPVVRQLPADGVAGSLDVTSHQQRAQFACLQFSRLLRGLVVGFTQNYSHPYWWTLHAMDGEIVGKWSSVLIKKFIIPHIFLTRRLNCLSLQSNRWQRTILRPVHVLHPDNIYQSVHALYACWSIVSGAEITFKSSMFYTFKDLFTGSGRHIKCKCTFWAILFKFWHQWLAKRQPIFSCIYFYFRLI